MCHIAEFAASNMLRQCEVDEIEPISLTSTFQNIWFSKALSKALSNKGFIVESLAAFPENVKNQGLDPNFRNSWRSGIDKIRS